MQVRIQRRWMTKAAAVLMVLLAACGTQSPAGGGASPRPSPTASPTATIDPAQEAALADQAKCEELLGPLLETLEDLDARLNVGLVFQDYTNRVGDVSVEYNQVRVGALPTDCVTDVGVHLENAMNAYIRADNRWNQCIGNFGCDIDSIESELQRQWREASQEIRMGRRGLRDLA
jgi:hypothetical protein